jgi:hypothetical protein
METKTDTDWSRTFADPIPLPDGGELRTLRDAADFRRAWWRSDAAKDRYDKSAASAPEIGTGSATEEARDVL